MAEILSEFGHLVGIASGNIQAATMPAYTSVPLGTIVQYIGTTTADYINGYFYKATASGWEVVDVQGEDTDKADKVDSATAGNLAGLNSSGNLTDAGWSADKTISNASGNPISISGLKTNQLAINPIITLEPIQAGSGDPSPSNVRAISGYDKIEVLSCGKNILNYDAWKGCPVVAGTAIYENNGVTLTATSNDCYTDYQYFPEEAYIHVKTGDIVTLSWDVIGTVNNGNVFIFGNGGTSSMVQTSVISKSLSYTVPEGVTFVTFRVGVGSAGNTIAYSNIQIELSSTATAYEPYNPIIDIQLTLGQTIYGGILDVEKGVLTVDKHYAYLDGSSDETWGKENDSWATNWTNNYYYFLENNAHFLDDEILLVANNLKALSINDFRFVNNQPYMTALGGHGSYLEVSSNETSVENFKTWLQSNPIQVVYKIKPYEIRLTPHEISLLKDYAYVSTNGTNMSFSYKNGEIASLSDVAQLGETINGLSNSVSELLPSQNVISEVVYTNGNSCYFKLKKPTGSSTSSRYTCRLTVCNQGSSSTVGLVGDYFIGVNPTTESIVELSNNPQAVSATITRDSSNADYVSISFSTTGIWASGILTGPKRYLV